MKVLTLIGENDINDVNKRLQLAQRAEEEKYQDFINFIRMNRIRAFVRIPFTRRLNLLSSTAITF